MICTSTPSTGLSVSMTAPGNRESSASPNRLTSELHFTLNIRGRRGPGQTAEVIRPHQHWRLAKVTYSATPRDEAEGPVISVSCRNASARPAWRRRPGTRVAETWPGFLFSAGCGRLGKLDALEAVGAGLLIEYGGATHSYRDLRNGLRQIFVGSHCTKIGKDWRWFFL
jgi:hypothetical protein